MRNSLYQIFRLICGMLAASFLLSCSPFTAPDRSLSTEALPAAFSLGETVRYPEQRWWSVFASPQLTGLIEDALAENLPLLSQWARLEKAQALADKSGSALYPSVSADGLASYARSHSGGDDAGRSPETKNYSIGLFTSYELDLWGRVRAEVKAADLGESATREDLNAAAMTVAAEVARRWLGILSRQQEIVLLRQQLANNQTYLELVEVRFLKSLASALDVLQQRQLVERVKAQIPQAEMQAQLLRNELAVLTGRLPGDLPPIAAQTLPVLNTPPPAGLPVQLLHNRPDIRAAFRRLEAADQNLVVAEADRLPAFRLTGSGEYATAEVDRIFDNWLLNLAASLTAPLLDGGRRQAEVAAAQASVKEQLALYRQTVLTAMREVEEALVREQRIREHIGFAEKQLEAARSALDEARVRYLNGLNDYLPVLTQLLSVQNLEKDLIAYKEELLDARISLFRAVGGTWTDELIVPAKIQPQQEDGKS